MNHWIGDKKKFERTVVPLIGQINLIRVIEKKFRRSASLLTQMPSVAALPRTEGCRETSKNSKSGLEIRPLPVPEFGTSVGASRWLCTVNLEKSPYQPLDAVSSLRLIKK
jgi:hypothetical protein